MGVGIDMTGFKVIYKGIIYNCLSMAPTFSTGEYDEEGKWKSVDPFVERIGIIYINSDNRVETLEDEAKEFQFIAK